MIKRSVRYIATTICFAILLVGSVTIAKATCTVYGTLNTSVHIVPLLKDTATAVTGVSYEYKDLDKVKSKTTVYAYDANGNYVTNSATASGAAAVEGRTSGQAKVSIRGMKRAYGTHKGKNATVSQYITTTTYFSK